MKLWNRIKYFFEKRFQKTAAMEVNNFMLEEPFYRGPLGDFPCSLKRREERRAYKENLVTTYTYQPEDDLLAKKQDFIDQYTVNEKEQLWYFTQTPIDRTDRARCKAWRDHEQIERREAQKSWRKVVHRNHRTHMRQKFLSENSRTH